MSQCEVTNMAVAGLMFLLCGGIETSVSLKYLLTMQFVCFVVMTSLGLFLSQEFYGPQFAVYKDGSGRGLGDILADLPDEKGRLLSNMKNALVPLVHKLDFGRHRDGCLPRPCFFVACSGKYWQGGS